MRKLDEAELNVVSGGAWSFSVEFAGVSIEFSGEETIQDIVGGAYWGARDAMADMFTALDPAGYYSSGCSGTSGR